MSDYVDSNGMNSNEFISNDSPATYEDEVYERELTIDDLSKPLPAKNSQESRQNVRAN